MCGTNNEQRKAYNNETREYATNHNLRWDSSDVEYLIEHIEEHTLTLALDLGRTYQAIQSRRQILKIRRMRRITLSNDNDQKPMTLNDACRERTRQLEAGIKYPTIRQVPGGYIVVEQRAAKEVQHGAMENIRKVGE